MPTHCDFAFVFAFMWWLEKAHIVRIWDHRPNKKEDVVGSHRTSDKSAPSTKCRAMLLYLDLYPRQDIPKWLTVLNNAITSKTLSAEEKQYYSELTREEALLDVETFALAIQDMQEDKKESSAVAASCTTSSCIEE